MLQLVNIVKNYTAATTTVQALKGVSLAFREHEFVAILGPSGCGKSTMLNIIGGLDRYTDGDLLIGGVSTKTFDDLHWDAYRNATIGFVFQSYNLIPHLTVLENVEMALALAGKKKKDRRAKAVAALHRVGMGDEINKRPNQLSGGQMQRVAIARALVSNPKIILADEPTGALDSELSVQVMDLLKEISETCLVIMVTHNAELANEYCSRICRFKDGMLISDSDPYKENPEKEETEEVAQEATTDTVTLYEGVEESHEAEVNDSSALPDGKRIVGGAILDPDEPDYSRMYDNEDDETRAKNVSNRKRKKAMRTLSAENKEQLDKLGVNSLSKKKKTPENKKDKSFKPTSMSAGMAFGISLRNLVSKKGRTVLTAFASSIGIIGLGLVLSISNGFKGYVHTMQTETMSGMPLGIYEYNVGVEIVEQMTGMMSDMISNPEGAYPDTDTLTVGPAGGAGGAMDLVNKVLSAFLGKVEKNDLSDDLDKYLHNNISDDQCAAISTYYGLRYNLVSKYTDESGEEKYADVSQHPPVSTVMSIAMSIFGQQGLQPDYWQILVGDEENMLENYDLIGENSRYPENDHELLLCVNADNTVAQELLDTFDIQIDTSKEVTADDFIGKSVRLVMNDDYYAYAQKNGVYDLNDNYDVDSSGAWRLKQNKQSELKYLYDGGEELRIVGVIRHKKDADGNYLTNSLCYTPELQAYVLERAYTSKIADAQRKLKEAEEAEPGFVAEDVTRETVFGVQRDDNLVSSASGGNVIDIIGKARAYTSFCRAIGAVKTPAYINVYPANFDQKQNAASVINNYRSEKGANIGYLDVAEMMVSTLNMIIDLVTVLLVAVASISLVVSSVMIGVITGNSVVERTREIGILRALGARKHDIRNVFVAETSVLGLFGGLMGIAITYILCPLISLIIEAATGGIGKGVAGLMIFNPLHALLLVVLSLVLTVVSGVAPAVMASRKNVVDALRIE